MVLRLKYISFIVYRLLIAAAAAVIAQACEKNLVIINLKLAVFEYCILCILLQPYFYCTFKALIISDDLFTIVADHIYESLPGTFLGKHII